ncbi:MAG: hypothetical protein FJ279_09935 [Planctomycetes bacterium]|nr:hypothetical protein [Planctomycetota bacterium]
MPARWAKEGAFHGVVVRELEPYHVQGQPSALGGWDVKGEEMRPSVGAAKDQPEVLTAPHYHPSLKLGKDATVSWTRPKMLSYCVVDPKELGSCELPKAEWWDGREWRPVPRPSPRSKGGGRMEVSFDPVATTALRVSGGEIKSVEAGLDAEGKAWFEAARASGFDVLGEAARKRSAANEPDYETVASLALPLDFLRGFIGRPDDDVETIVTWNGTLLQSLTLTGSAVKGQDRWFAFAVNGELPGGNPELADAKCLEGWLPGVELAWRPVRLWRIVREKAPAIAGGPNLLGEEPQQVGDSELRPPLQCNLTAFTTASGDKVYADLTRVEVTNPSEKAVKASLTLALGRRPNTMVFHRASEKGMPPANPCYLDPVPTGYQPGPDGASVRSAEGQVVAFADRRGEWGGTPLESHLTFQLDLKPRGKQAIRFVFPHLTAPVTDEKALAKLDFDKSLRLFRDYWAKEVTRGMRIHVPDERVNLIARNHLAQRLIIPDQSVSKYGTYFYEWPIGLEDWWPIIALAQWGYAAEAKRLAADIIDRYKKDLGGGHQGYRTGLGGMGGREVFALTGDEAWAKSVLPELKRKVEWTLSQRREPEQNPLGQGLLRKDTYGGDVHAPAFAAYGNMTCWRGMRDTAWVAERLGEKELAQTYRAEAAEYRRRIHEVFADKLLDKSTDLPFVPNAFEIGDPAKMDTHAGKFREREKPYPSLHQDLLGGYWNLFMGMALELDLFPAGSEPSRWVTDYMEQRGGVALGLARFMDGVDWHYGVGYLKTLLERGERAKFLTSYYGALAHGGSRSLLGTPEAARIWPTRVSNEALAAEFRVNVWNWTGYYEALSAAPGVALQLLRLMLVREGKDADGEYDGSLVLLSGIPRRWLEDGKEIAIENAPTHFGPISLTAKSRLAKKRVEVKLQLSDPPYGGPSRIVLHLPVPDGLKLQSAEVNGKPVKPLAKGVIAFPADSASLKVVAAF